MHKKRFPNDQKTIMMHTVDAHGGFPPSSAATTVPLWRFIPSKLMGRGFSDGPFSFSLLRLSDRFVSGIMRYRKPPDAPGISRTLCDLFSLNLKHSSRQVALTSLEHVLGGQSPRNLTAPEFRQVVDQCLSLDQPIKPDCTAWKLKVEE
ncbi:hypothetical protein [Sinorhizobium americanum]|uniref:hypothetical protein n=1 Tax=Sinorhizobium americanum TaxID=194963 RepID=UPI001404E98F|nr:hypothetical protein [Sinorhizobium americanum]